MKLKSTPAPTLGASSTDREAWLEQRRHGITATEVRDAAKGSTTEVRRIIADKVANSFRDLSGNQYVAWGQEREPHIAALVESKYGIPPNQRVMASGTNPRYLATPDGYVEDPVLERRLIAEFKTSKHNLEPGVPTVTPADFNEMARAKERQETVPYFWTTGYYDQAQFQMLVAGAESCLFAWEGHNNDWPNPTPKPVRTFWIVADPERQAYLATVADDLLVKLDESMTGTVPMDLGTIPADIVDDVHQVLEYRNAEAIAKAGKTAAWNRVLAWLNKHEPKGTQYESKDAKVSWSVTTTEALSGYDLTGATDKQRAAHEARLAKVDAATTRVDKAHAALTKAQDARAAAVARYEKAAHRWAIMEPRTSAPHLTITAPKGGK